jgi:hypothetical protein
MGDVDDGRTRGAERVARPIVAKEWRPPRSGTEFDDSYSWISVDFFRSIDEGRDEEG